MSCSWRASHARTVRVKPHHPTKQPCERASVSTASPYSRRPRASSTRRRMSVTDRFSTIETPVRLTWPQPPHYAPASSEAAHPEEWRTFRGCCLDAQLARCQHRSIEAYLVKEVVN